MVLVSTPLGPYSVDELFLAYLARGARLLLKA